MLISSFLMYRRMAKAERESDTLRKDAGYLAISDENLFHAVFIKTYEPHTWRWRVYIPSKCRFSLKTMNGEISEKELPAEEDIGFGSDKGGECVINAAMRQDKNDKWFLRLTCSHDKLGDMSGASRSWSTSSPISDDVANKFTANNIGTNYVVFGADGSASQVIDKPILLLKYRLSKTDGSGRWYGTPDPMPGIMIWIQIK
jgi:hypothetical protein